MAVELGTGFVSLTVSARGISQSIAKELGPVQSQATQAGQQAGQSFASRFQTGVSGIAASAGKLIAGGFTAGVAGAGILTGSLLKVGTSYNALEQKSKAAFTTILGSGEAATTMMDQLREFAKTSPFPRQAFIEGTQQLLGFGVSAQRIIPTLSAIQDAVASVGGGSEQISQITFALAQIQSQGKFTGETLNQLGGLGIDAATILGEQFGKTGAEIRDMASRPGGIPADQVFDPLVAGLTEKFGGAAEGVKATWVGAVDRIKGAFRDIGSDIFDPLVSKAAIGGGAATGWANQFADALRSIQATIVPALATGIGSLALKIQPFVDKFVAFIKNISAADVTAFVDKIQSAFQSIGPLIAGAASALGTFGAGQLPFIGQLAGALNPVAIGFIAIAAASPEVRAAFAGLVPIFADIAKTLVGALAPVLPVVASAIGQIASVVGQLLATGLAALAPVFGALVTAITPIIPIIANLVSSLGGPLIKVIEALAPVVATVAETLGGALADALTTLGPVLPGLADALGAVAVAVGTDLASSLAALAPVLPAFAELARIGAELIAAVPPDVLARIVEAFIAFKGVQAVTGNVQSLAADVRGLAGTFTGAAGTVKGFFAAGGGKDTIGIRFLQIRDAAGTVGSALSTAGSAISTFAANVGTQFKTAASSVGTFASSVGSKTVSAFQSVGSTLKTAGTAVAQYGKAALATAAGIARQTAAFVVQKVATAAAAVATRVLAAAQWLLNVAMDANPIGLIVIAIAALVAGFVLAYQNITPFREAVDAAFVVIQEVAQWIIANWPIAFAVLTGGMSLVAGLIIANWDTIKNVVQTAVAFIVDFVSANWPILLAILTGGLSLLVAFVASNWDSIKAIISGAVNAIVGTVTGFINIVTGIWNTGWHALIAAVDVLREVPGRILGAIGNVGTLLLGIGRDIVQGLVNGIKGAWHLVEDTIGGLADHLPGVVKDVLGIGSPSKVFAEIGTNISQGLTIGISRSATGPLKALQETARLLASTPFTVPAVLPASSTLHRSVIPALPDATRNLAAGAQQASIASNAQLSAPAGRSSPALVIENMHAWNAREAAAAISDELAWHEKTSGRV